MTGDLVAVHSSTPCPSADDVAAALRRVLPGRSSLDATGDVATVGEFRAEDGPWLEVRLQRADGSPKGEKSFRAQGGCLDRAELVATVIAIWEPDLPQAIPDHPGRLTLAIGGSAGLAFYQGLAAVGIVEGTLDWHAQPWGLRLAMGSETERRRSLSIGEVGWRHTTMAAGIRVRTGGTAWRLAADGGPILGWATMSGHGFDPERQASVFEVGGGAGLRVERRFRSVALWVEARANLWSKRHEVFLDGSPDRQTFSQVDLMINLGMSFMLFR
jgi:hypothetical protein